MVVVGSRDWGGREGLLCFSTRGATVPPVGTVHISAMAAARVGGAENASRGALPTAGKWEGSSF